MFSILINGQVEGYFSGQMGLMQGDPMSSFLFVICIDYFTRIMNKTTASGFTFHQWCKELKLSHLCFVDDFFLCLLMEMWIQLRLFSQLLFIFRVSLVLDQIFIRVSFSLMKLMGQLERKFIAFYNLMKYLRTPLISCKLTEHHWQDLSTRFQLDL